MNKKHLFWLIPSALILLILILYLLLPVIAKASLQKKIERFEREKNAELTLTDLHIGLMNFRGIVPISFEGAQLRGRNADDTLLRLTKMNAEIQVIRGLHLTDDLISLSCDSISIHLIHNKTYRNYGFLTEKSSKEGHAITQYNNYKQLSENILEYIDNILPQMMSVGAFTLSADVHERQFYYSMSDFSIFDGKIQGHLTEEFGPIHHTWSLDGNLDHSTRNYRASMTALDGNNGFAIINELKKAHFGFTRLEGELSDDGSDADGTHYTLFVEGDGLLLNHRYLATRDVTIDSTSAHFHLTISEKAITIDSTSVLKLNETEIHPFFTYEKNGNRKPRVSLYIHEEDRDAKQFIGSLPDGLFQVIPDLQLTGRIDFCLFFDCDFNEVDSLAFDFSIGSHNRSVSINGDVAKITRFNAPFDYVFFENGDTARVVNIGPDNPHFCPFDQIPPYLTKSILATEDAGFFQHRGFIKSSIREALIADIKAGKLRRGGSTLTMQLIKNLFLNRNKVFSRKFEEMLLVWLIEDYRLISKERMFEIYVNIAEWGPGIIGIGEASDFYFGKKPQELTLSECLYLASLIRAPKHYRNTLDEYGNVINSKREELFFVARRMVEREFITEDEFSRFNTFIHTKCMENVDE